MKKFSLLLCCFVALLVSQKVMADDFQVTQGGLTIKVVNPTLTIESTAGGLLNNYMSNVGVAGYVSAANLSSMQACTTIVLDGVFSSSDLSAISHSQGFEAVTTVDMSAAVFSKTFLSANYKLYNSGFARPESPVSGQKIIAGGTLYKSASSTTKMRQPITADDYGNSSITNNNTQEPSDWSYREIDDQELIDDKYYKIIVADYYRQQFYWAIDVENSNASAVESLPQEGSNDGQQIKVPSAFAYYKLSIDDTNQRSWVEATQEEIVSHSFTLELDVDDNNKNNVLYNYNNTNPFVKFATSYTYYKWTKKWVAINESAIPYNSTITYFNISYEGNENYRLTETFDIVGFVREYYYCHVVQTTTYYWKNTPETYTDGTEKEIFCTALTFGTLQTPSEADKWAVVGGTEYEYSSGDWTTVPLTDYSSISFLYWKETLLEVILPASITSTQLPENVFRHNDDWCKNITSVKSGNTVATITHDSNDGNKPVSTVINASSLEEGTRLKDILLRSSNFVPQDADHLSITYPTTSGLNGFIYRVIGSLTSSVINSVVGTIKVLDLSNAGEDVVTQEMIGGLKRNDIEYIILPGDKTKDFVCDLHNGTKYNITNSAADGYLPKLKAVIAAESTTLVAHLIVPGHLATARGYATGYKGNDPNDASKPVVMGLTTVTLSGKLNANDLSTHDEDKGLSGENSTITTMDLEKAIFVNSENAVDCSQMNFQAAGFQGQSNECVLTDIKLPTDEAMTDIPQDCFRNMKSLQRLCIPYNYKVLHNGALYDSSIEHLTTTDRHGNLVDKGEYTYVLSANLTQLGDEPNPKLDGNGEPNGVTICVFPKENGVKDIYSLATVVPKCYKNVFAYDLTFGYGGQDQEKVYCRDRYFNNGDPKKSFVVLRYPSEEVYKVRKEQEKTLTGTLVDPDGYAKMQEKYTDVTKEYTKKDQTGAVDADGNPLLWPTRTEGNRSYGQASVGALWEDWGKSYNGDNGKEINDTYLEPAPASARIVRRDISSEDIINLDHGRSENVTMTVSDGVYIFTPTADVQNMFQYMNWEVDNTTYQKIVIEFDEKVPDGFFIHHYGVRDNYYSIAGLERYELPLTGGSTIDDFTIFNWDGYDWSKADRSIKIRRAYFSSETAASNSSESARYNHNDLIDYIGWHQIVLTQATYVETNPETIVNNRIEREYVDAGWYTFCIPYNMTYRQVVDMMGVPKSDDKYRNMYDNSEQSVDRMPQIRQLQSVTRTRKGVGTNTGNSNLIDIRLTTDLAVQGKKTAQYLEFTHEGNNMTTHTKYASNNSESAPSDVTGDAGDDRICLVGGRPYFIKAYVRANEKDILNGTDYNYNLGKFIMQRYADQFDMNASCVHNTKKVIEDNQEKEVLDDNYFEQMETFQETGAKSSDVSGVSVASTNLTTMRFAKPYENHKVRAFGQESSTEAGYLEFTKERVGSADATGNFYYTMIGQFWPQELPQYCIYYAPKKDLWYRYSTKYNYSWEPYKCIIMATPEVTEAADLVTETISSDEVIGKSMGIIEIPADQAAKEKDVVERFTSLPSDYTFAHFGGGFRNINNCYFPMNYKETTDWIPAPLKLCFFGRDDRSFDNQKLPSSSSGSGSGSETRYIISMGDNDEILDFGEEVTEVKAIDMLDGVPQLDGNSRVYNMSGQYMGTSTENLSKGVYIVGGRKVVINR